MKPNRSPVYWKCLRKRMFLTKKEANDEIARMVRIDSNGGKNTATHKLSCYKCKFCVGYHIGNK